MVSKLIIDCDPGTDDAIALLLALASPEIEVIGVTVVAGNVGLPRTVENARRIMALAGGTAPVLAGVHRPITHALVTATHVHGDDGLGGISLPAATQPSDPRHAVDWLRETLRMAEPGSITLCAVGPLTNVALALLLEPDIATALTRIVVMGGAIGLGNVTAAAEFNIHVDPQAADIVLTSGVPVVLVPLDVTHAALASADHISRLRNLGTVAGRVTADILDAVPRHPRHPDGGVPIHDACAVAACIAPRLFDGRSAHVSVDTTSGPSRGRTNVDWWGKSGHANALVLEAIDAEAFFDLLIDRLSRCTP